jgi:hypothetical protein
VQDRILQAYRDGERRVLVDSPPGAGKTRLVEDTAAEGATENGWRVGVGTNTRNQRDDFAVRFRSRFPRIPLQVMLSSGETPSSSLLVAGVPAINHFNHRNRGAGVLVSTVHRHFYGVDHVPNGASGLYNLVIADEAYQIQYRNGGLPLDALAPNRLMVGDPGQIAPFTELDVEIFESARDHVLWSLPAETARNEPDMPRFQLPNSRRLPPDTVKLLQPALYPTLPFGATATDAERRVVMAAAGATGDAIDGALDAVGDGASIVAISLPDVGYELEVDPELSTVAVEVAKRVHYRRATWQHERRQIDINRDIFYIDSHVTSVTEAKAKFTAASIDLRADTPNVIQGQENLVAIVKHPLSSLQEADGFHLDPGRLCVMLSRHKLCCILLVRGDVQTILGDYEHDAGERLLGREDLVWRGYSAHRLIWRALVNMGRVFKC